MMKRLLVIIIWLIVFIGDGIVFPALTGLSAGFGIMVLLSALAITFGIHRWLIGLGIILAGLTELILGTYFGTIIGAWLAMAWAWYLLNQFLNMKPMSENNSLSAFLPLTLFGLGLFGFGEGVLWAISCFVYEPGLTTTILIDTLRSPVIFCIVAIELVITLFVLRFIYLSRANIYA